MKGANYVVVDVETGGLFSRNQYEADGKIKKYKDKDSGNMLECKANPITQIALQTIDFLKLTPSNEYETFVQRYNDFEITEGALRASLVSMAKIAKGIDFKTLYKQLIAYFKNVNTNKHPSNRPILVGHNIQFDMGFLEVLFELNGDDLYNYVSRTTICTMAQAKMTWDLELKGDDIKSYKLGLCCERAGIKLKDAHGAMNDVRATGKLLLYLIKRLRGNNIQTDTEEINKEPKKAKARDFYQF